MCLRHTGVDTVIRHLFVERDGVAGLATWQFCDVCNSEAAHGTLGRPRGFNNKGVVDEYRCPKAAHNAVKRAFRARGRKAGFIGLRVAGGASYS